MYAVTSATDGEIATAGGGSDRVPADAITTQTLQIIQDIGDKRAAFELPAPSPEFGRSQAKLAESSYSILVVGEAKRGKSTLVNALIGRDVLPTDVDVATSQVFKVSRGPEAYRLRFEDESTKEITAADLPRHGSQVVLNEEGRPRLDQTIRWIEVEVPARFLPARISVFDTPGLGALYAAHAQITHRFIPHADAVIFVLDSGQPIVQAELELIERILAVTPNIFFVQTKIDQHGKEQWEEVKARSEALLGERFGDRLADVRVWPISSKNLRAAAESNHPDALLMVSRYRALADALQKFLLRVSGHARSAQALAIAARYHAASRALLECRLEALETTADQKLVDDVRAVAQRKQEFEANWGPRGQKRADLGRELKKAASISKQAFREALQPAGRIAGPIDARIEAIGSDAEISQLGEGLSDELINAVGQEWRVVRELSERRASELLVGFLDVADRVALPTPNNEESIALSERRLRGGEMSGFETLTGVYSGVAPLGLAALLGVALSPMLVLLGGAWGALHGLKRVEQGRLNARKNELRQLLKVRLQELQHHYLGVDVHAQRFSYVDEYFIALERTVVEQVDATTKRKLEETEAELARLQSQAALDAEQRKAQIALLRKQLGEWDGLASTIAELAETRELGEALEHMRLSVVAATGPAPPSKAPTPASG
jgi:GTPase SAR1 family protein